VYCKIGRTGRERERERERCKASSLTIAQINLLAGLVTIRDEGSMELGIGDYDRVVIIGEASEPFNAALADYFKEEDVGELHVTLCLAKINGTSLGRLNIPA
jgi:hypothetical protein